MNPFDLVNPRSVAEAVQLLPESEGDESVRLLAGGQDIVTELKEHLIEPDKLVNLKSIPQLDGITWNSDGSLTLGALACLQDIADDARVRSEMAVLAEAAESVASPQIRSQGTIGGNLNQRPRCWYYRTEHAPCIKKGGVECFSYEGKNKYNCILGGGPSYIVHPSDCAPALVALGATATLVSPDGEREVALGDYFTLPASGNILRETVLAPNEVMTRITVPAPEPGMRSTYLKFKERASFDWALAAVAACVWTDGEKVTDARIVLGGVAPTPWRTPGAEQRLVGSSLTLETLQAVGREALEGAEPLSENGFKIPLTKGLIARAFLKLA